MTTARYERETDGEKRWPPTPHSANTAIYHERQVRQHCQIHAINNLLGYRLLDYQHVLQYCNAVQGTLQGPTGAYRTWSRAYNSQSGFYATPRVNHYMRHNTRVEGTDCPYIATMGIGYTIALGSDRETILASIASTHLGAGALSLGFTLQGGGQALAVRRIGDLWYHIDSQRGRPIEMWPPTPHSANTAIYHERQVRQHCQIHAINNLLGYRLLDYQHVLQYCNAVQGTLQGPTGAYRTWSRAYNSQSGFYATPLVNHYMRHNTRVEGTDCPYIATMGIGYTIALGSD
ncbi:hypothetical protein TSOC_013834, partial [Tetrabaena socialis]